MLSNRLSRRASPGKSDRSATRRARLGVTPLEERCVPTIFVVTSAGDTIAQDGQVTLREAITAANTNKVSGDAPAGTPGLDTIRFAINSGQQTINLLSALPQLTDSVTIDGTTQPLFAGKPIIQIVAPSGNPTTGLTVQSTNSTVRGLVLNKFGSAILLGGGGSHLVAGNYIGTAFDGLSIVPGSPSNSTGIAVNSSNNFIGVGSGDGNLINGQRDGIYFFGGSFNRVKGNLIGTDATGANKLGNGGGIFIGTGSHRNYIGGTDEGDGRNVISGNGAGVTVLGSRNVIQANYIGTNANGTLPVSNINGLTVEGRLNVIGGTGPGAGNVISGNTRFGMVLSGARATVQGNRIGTDQSGSGALGNGLHGVLVYGSNHLIGGALDTAANLIHYNGLSGVAIDRGSGTAIRRNSFFQNAEQAIDLNTNNDEGSTFNDDLDADTGANGLQNFPVLIFASNNYVEGVLNSRKNRTYIIDLYSSPTAVNPESGQGTTYLRSFSVKTDADGDAPFTIYVGQGIPTGHFVTATATTIANAPYGDTSEFSPVVQNEYSGGGTLTAASMAPTTSVAKLTAARAQSLLGEAIRRWQDSGVDTSALQGISIRIAGLGGNTLGRAVGNTIWLDSNAAGWGWFVDQSPRNDSEFQTPGNQGEQKRMDLLSVLMHEVGHLLGRDHVDSTASSPNNVMAETLTVGTRSGIA